jgi:hypothetical protein
MPLTPGSSHAVIGSNIREMVKAGHPPRVAVAAALSNADRHPNDVGLASRKLPNPMHVNDVGLKQRVRALPVQAMHPNDVGLGMRVGGPAIRSSVHGMSKNEMSSRRAEIGRMPRA